MPTFVPTIGLEVHCQLNTRTKLFCACPAGVVAPPNTAVCGVCLGFPGTLPVLNDEAVRLAVRAGYAVGCTVHERSRFARKHYFYPDNPKGYQISQFDRPICTDGALHIEADGGRKRFGIERIHIEEDAGKLAHDGQRSLIDWNRGGTPLIEIVGRPDLHSADDAESFLRMLHRVMVAAGVTQGDMEKGHFRADANVSVSADPSRLGTRVELKNINSFKFVAKAIRHEVKRQVALLESGRPVVQSTRSWTGHESVPLRTKEEAADYRYFTEPDMGPIHVVEADRAAAESALNGRPLDRWLLDNDAARRDAFQRVHGLGAADAMALLANGDLRRLFEATVERGAPPSDAVKWIRGPVARWFNEHATQSLLLTPSALAAIIAMVDSGRITRAVGRELVDEACASGGDPEALVKQRGLETLQDAGALRAAVDAAIAAHPAEVIRYRDGQRQLLGFFIGLIMREFAGRMDAVEVRTAVQSALEDVVSIGGAEKTN